MKKLIALCIGVCLCLLGGCSASEELPTQNAIDFRTALMGAKGCRFTAEVTADYGDKVYVFSLQSETMDGETSLQVLSPENIAGIQATISADGAELEFDSVALTFGKLANGYVSPVSVPWLLEQCWQSAYIAYAGADEEYDRVTYLRGYNEEELSVDTWFLNQTPVYAEVVWNDVRCLQVTIKDFQLIQT